MDKIDMTFLRSVQSKIDDCSSALQLRQVFSRFKPYLYNGQISNSFMSRLETIREISDNPDMCDELEDEIETEIKISRVCKPNQIIPEKKRSNRGRRKDKPLEPESKLVMEFSLETTEGRVLEDVLNQTIKIILEKSLGKKKEASRILGLSYKELLSKLRDIPELRKYMKRVKSEIRKTDVVKKF